MSVPIDQGIQEKLTSTTASIAGLPGGNPEFPGQEVSIQETWLNKVHCGHALDILWNMPSSLVDLIVTSPPYWGLRAYGEESRTTWPDGWYGQLGLEPDFRDFVKHLVVIFKQCRRILKETGSLYVVIGDTYAGGGGVEGKPAWWEDLHTSHGEKYPERPPAKYIDLPAGSKIQVPERFSIAMQEDGWILRDDIIWYKRNHTPSSAKSRLTNTYEHIYHFVRNTSKVLLWRLYEDWNGHKAGDWLTERPNTPHRHEKGPFGEPGKLKWMGFHYFYELDLIRRPHKGKPSGNIERKLRSSELHHGHIGSSIPWEPGDQGKNPGDVIYKGKFDQAIDPEVFSSPRARIQRIKRRIGDPHSGEATANLYDPSHKFYHELGGNPGDVKQEEEGEDSVDFWDITTAAGNKEEGAHFAVFPLSLMWDPILSSSPIDGIVMDPFAGSGTVAEAVEILNYLGNRRPTAQQVKDFKKKLPHNSVALGPSRKWVMIEINPNYCEIIKKRLAQYDPVKQNQG